MKVGVCRPPVPQSRKVIARRVFRLDEGLSFPGICLTSGETAQCAYQTQCETIVAYSGDRGEILLNDLLLSNRMSLCFVIMTKEKHHLRLIIDQRSDLEFVIYDGDQAGNILLASSYSLLNKQMVQTRQSHTATIVIHQRSIDAENSPSDQLVLNITWMTSICLENQFLCSGHFERKCYSKQQRCDGSRVHKILFSPMLSISIL